VAANKEFSQVNARLKDLRDEIGFTALISGHLKNLAVNSTASLRSWPRLPARPRG